MGDRSISSPAPRERHVSFAQQPSVRIFDQEATPSLHLGSHPAFDLWSDCVCVQNRRGVLHVKLAQRGLDDASLKGWCDWAHHHLRSCLPRPCHGISVDLSRNIIGDDGCRAFVQVLESLNVPVHTLMLFGNRISHEGAAALAGYLIQHPIEELHLSHNQIDKQGAMKIIRAVAVSCDSHGRPIYPLRGVGGMPCKPLWLRLEHNAIEVAWNEEDTWRKAEEEMRQLRCERGLLDPGMEAPMLCPAPYGCGCESKRCSRMVLGSDGVALGPLVQVPWAFRQRRPGEEPLPPRGPGGGRPAWGLQPRQKGGGCRSSGPPGWRPRPALAPPRAATALDGSDADSDSTDIAPPAVKAPAPTISARPCYYTDFRINAGATFGGSSANEHAVVLTGKEQPPPPPPDDDGHAASEASPPPPPPPPPPPALAGPPMPKALLQGDGASLKASPEPPVPKELTVGASARVVQSFTSPPKGYSRENYLVPLCVDQEVRLLWLAEPEDEDRDWCYAGLLTGEEGYVPKSALKAI